MKSLDKKKTKELDWEEKTYKFIKNILLDAEEKKVPHPVLISQIFSLLTQQRTEILEEIDTKWKNKIKKVKEQIFGSDKTWNKTLNEISTFRPDLAEQFNIIYMRFTNLLNKKDE